MRLSEYHSLPSFNIDDDAFVLFHVFIAIIAAIAAIARSFSDEDCTGMFNPVITTIAIIVTIAVIAMSFSDEDCLGTFITAIAIIVTIAAIASSYSDEAIQYFQRFLDCFTTRRIKRIGI